MHGRIDTTRITIRSSPSNISPKISRDIIPHINVNIDQNVIFNRPFKARIALGEISGSDFPFHRSFSFSNKTLSKTYCSMLLDNILIHVDV